MAIALEAPADVRLIGKLEKCSRWRREWVSRFFVLRSQRLEYFVEPFADFSIVRVPKGTIRLEAPVSTTDVGRPYCLQVGSELLSCCTRDEQQAWITAINEELAGTATPVPSYSSTAAGGTSGEAPCSPSADVPVEGLLVPETEDLARRASVELPLPEVGLERSQTTPSTIEWTRSVSPHRAHSFPEAATAPPTPGAARQAAMHEHYGSLQCGRDSAGAAASEPRPKPEEDWKLVLLSPADEPRSLEWEVPVKVTFRTGEVIATVLVVTGTEQFLCRVPLLEAQSRARQGASDVSCPLEPLAATSDQVIEQHSPQALRVTFLGVSQVEADAPDTRKDSSFMDSPLPLLTMACLALSGSLHIASSSIAGCLALLVAVLLLVIDVRRATGPHTMLIATLCFERRDPHGSIFPRVPSGDGEDIPLWVGSWRLDKAASDKYEPILAELGMNWMLRKAIDAKTSTVDIWCVDNVVVISVSNLATVVDELPIDGSPILRPVPPATRFRGMMKVRLAYQSATELILSSELPACEGEVLELLDVTVVHDGGAWLTRRTRLGQTEVTRVFRRRSV